MQECSNNLIYLKKSFHSRDWINLVIDNYRYDVIDA